MSIQWIPLETPEQLQHILTESVTQPVLIYKHSSRCSISSTVLGRMERSEATLKDFKAYFLDVLNDRAISNLVAGMFSVQHESPQLLLISGGEAVLHLSHFEIEPGAIRHNSLKT